MKKRILDRLNILKGELRVEMIPKSNGRIDEEKIIALLARMDELKRLLK